MDRKTVETIEIAAALYDVGKIGIPSYILHKPGPLTMSEFEKMRTHAAVGATMISSIDFQGPVVDIVRHHHENWDGSGYPDGLKGEEIPYGARLIAVASCYEALRSPRPYRIGLLGRDEAVAIMKSEAHRFDPSIFKTFLEAVSQIDEAWAKTEGADSTADLEEHREGTGSSGTESMQEVCDHLFDVLLSSITRKDIFRILEAKLETIVSFHTLVIFLMDEEVGTLIADLVIGRNKNGFQGLKIDFGTGLAGWVAANDRPLCNIHPGPDLSGLKEEIQESYQNAMLFPLVFAEQPLGTIGLYRTDRERYSDDHIRLMEIITNRISTALYNASRFDETTEDPFTDRLTGLGNSRSLFIFLEQALSEAKRNNECLTVISMDLDDFKDINNRHGYDLGNRFLIEVGRLLKDQMRDGDVLVRYAGDEFIAFLPKTTPEQARQFAGRILDAVKGAAIDIGIGSTLSVEISLGLASFPNDGSDIEVLLLVADKNMYKHKARRRTNKRRS